MKQKLGEWMIVGCLRCHLLQIVRSDQKTRKCLKCGYLIKIDFRRILVWFKSRDIKEAEDALQKFKLLQKQGKLFRRM